MALSVLHLASDMHWWGGIPRHIIDLARSQHAGGDRVLIACRSGSAIETKAKELGLAVMNLTMKHRWHWTRFPQYLKLFDHGIDVVHVHYPSDYVVPAFAARLRRLPAVILTRHHPHAFRSPLTAFVCCRVIYDGLIAVSDSVRSTLISSGAPPEKVFVVPNGIDLDAFQFNRKAGEAIRRELKVPEEAVVLAAVGRLSPEKGYALLLEAVRRVFERGTQVHVVILGRGPEKEALQKLAVQLELERYVHLPGFRPDVCGFYSAADIVVVPSLYFESFGYVAVEALACTRPVIACHVGGLGEIITEDCGILVAPNDPVALSAGIERLACDKAERQRLAQNARKRASRFSLTAMVLGVESVYRAVLRCA